MPEIKSVADLLTIIRESDLSTKDHAHLRFWFRGHSRTGWKLEPAVYRPPWPANEKERLWRERHLTQDFRLFSAGLRTGSETDADIYFLQQHYRMPTRLLDWTTNPLAALHFVVCGDLQHDGELFLMDAYQLAHTQGAAADFLGIATSRNPIFTEAMDIIANWSKKAFRAFILPVRPDHFDQRISRQQGYFTFYVPKRPQLTEKENSTLRTFRVPKHAKSSVQSELSLLGVNTFTAFGDLDHLADWLKTAHACATRTIT
jgi:hypothetical protein